MAKIVFKLGEEYTEKLKKLADRSDEVAERALHEAAGIVADKIRENIRALPEEKFRYLRDGDMFNGVPRDQKEFLLYCFGISPIKRDREGILAVKIGFANHAGIYSSKTYPNGLPAQLIAGSIESGTSVRQKHPFVRPAVNATKKAAEEAMQRVIDEEIEKTMKG